MRYHNTLKFFAIVTILITVLTVGLYFSFYDKVVTSGSGFGYSIGMTKYDAFYKAKELYKGSNVYTLHVLSRPGSGPDRMYFSDDEYMIFKSRNRWKFYFDENLNNVVRLEFVNDELVRIYRHRYLIELP